MKEAALAVTSRGESGKNVARRLRREGLVPASLYGPEREPKNLCVSLKTLEKLFREGLGGNVILSLEIDDSGPSAEKTLLRSVQRDPVTGQILHLDLHQISMTKPIHLMIPVHLNGIPEGVKNSGGVMQQIIREIEISCLPTQIPDAVELDVSELGIHDSIHISRVEIPNATIIMDSTRTIVTVVPPTVSTETTEEGEEGVEGAEVEVVSEGAEAGAKSEGDDKSEDDKK